MENFDIKYLQNEGLHEVLAEGLAEIFNKKPKFPIQYLEQWLRNFNQLKKSKRKALKERKKIENIRFRIEQKFYEDLKKKKKKETMNVIEKRKEKKFEERIENVKFVSDVLDTQFCDEIKRVGQLTKDFELELGASAQNGLALPRSGLSERRPTGCAFGQRKGKDNSQESRSRLADQPNFGRKGHAGKPKQLRL